MLSALILVLGALQPRNQESAPPLAEKQISALVAEYVELDGRSDAGMRRQDEILAALANLPALDERRAAKWRDEILADWRQGPELDKKSGRHFLNEDEERGLYILGGETRRPTGLFIGMHGGGVGSGDAWTSHGAFNSAAGRRKWLAIFPEVLEKTEQGWTTSGTEEFVLELIDRACRTWKIDRDAVFFGGHSMGGYGTWTLGAHHVDIVAGLAASAGAPTPIRNRDETISGIDWGVVPNLRNVRMVVYQSDDDVQVPPDANRFAVAEVARAKERWGGYERFEYWEVSGQGHGPPPGDYAALLDKVADARRDARPEKFVWQPVLSWKRQMHWLWWQAPPIDKGVIVVAELDRAANRVRVTGPASLAGLWILVDGELVDMSRELIVEQNGEVVFAGRPQPSLAAVLASSAHGDRARAFLARVPLR